jgi:tetratricopeptide (TPR) repeat protein
VAWFFRFVKRAPASPPSPLEQGERALRRGDLVGASTCFDAALDAARSDRERALIYNKHALVAIARGDRDAAASVLETALATYAACVPALVNAGNLLLEAGDLDGAIARFQTAITLDPDYADAHHNLGVAYKRAGRRSDAVRELRRATGLERRRKNGPP